MIKIPEFNFKKAFFGSFLIAFVVVAVLVLILNWSRIFNTKNAEAAENDNVRGFAWSENIGWISMNDIDTVSGNYGVNIDEAGNISGYAWSENIGWLCFGDTCSSYGNTPEGVASYAEVNSSTEEISGWAKIISITEDDSSWISLRKWQALDPTYGVKICLNGGCDYTDALGNPAVAGAGDWYYWAWTPAIGWIDFSGVSSNWSITNPFTAADLDGFQPEGIFEPLCCDGNPACAACISNPLNCNYEDVKDIDTYCDGDKEGEDLKGLHLHTVKFSLSNFDESFNGKTVECQIDIPGLCQNTPPVDPLKTACRDDNQCGSYCEGGIDEFKSCEGDPDCQGGSCSDYEGPCEPDIAPVNEIIFSSIIENGEAKFAYTLDSALDYSALSGIKVDKRLPWRIEGCKFSTDENYLAIFYNWRGTDEDCNNGEDDDGDSKVDAGDSDCRRPLILAHENTWEILGNADYDAARALGCWAGSEHKYFYNEEICNYIGDYTYSWNVKKEKETVEWDCGDGIDNDGDCFKLNDESGDDSNSDGIICGKGDRLVDCEDSDCFGIATECVEHAKTGGQ